jgi:hypothetical protein
MLMLAKLCGGLLLASLVTAAEVPNPDSALGQGCAKDAADHLEAGWQSPPEELHGLDLLQTDVHLMKQVSHAQPVLHMTAPTSNSNPESAKEAALASLGALSPVSLLEIEATGKHSVSVANVHVMARFVTGLTTKDGATIIIVLAVLVLLCFLVCFLVPSFMGGSAHQGRLPPLPFVPDTPAKASPAQALLQAPQMTNPAQSPMQASYAKKRPQANVSSPSNLPPICPSLILPHTEARFMVPTENIIRGQGQLEIRGTSGRRLLSGTITDTPAGHRCLALASCGCEEDPRVTILSPPREYGRETRPGTLDTLEIFGKGGTYYGTLEQASNGGAVLKCSDQAVMSLEIAGADMKMTASAMDGRLLATAGKHVQVSIRSEEAGDTWKLQVKPNCDAVLIASCMLGVLLFGDGLGR